MFVISFLAIAAPPDARQANPGAASATFLPDFTPTAGEGYQKTLKKAQDLIFIFLHSIEQRTDIGLNEKQRLAVEFIRNVRWGPAGRNYFWIGDTRGNMILEPFYPGAEGKNHIDIRDRNNKALFIEYIRITREGAEGFIEHHGLGYDGNKTDPMISMVRLFKSWGWIVGTGIPLALVEAYEEPEGLQFDIPLPEINDESPASSI